MTRTEPRTRAIIVVARFAADGSRRAKVCLDVEEVRAFLAGENVYAGRNLGVYEFQQMGQLGAGVEEKRIELEAATSAEILQALRDAIV